MSIEEIALRLIESDCSTDYYFKILDELGNNTTKIQELEREKLHIEIAYEEDYKEQQQEIERLNNIINGIEKWLKEEYEGTIFDYHNAIEDVLNKLQELKGSNDNE